MVDLQSIGSLATRIRHQLINRNVQRLEQWAYCLRDKYKDTVTASLILSVPVKTKITSLLSTGIYVSLLCFMTCMNPTVSCKMYSVH